MSKRVISVLMALMLVLTLFPASALADEPEESGNLIAGPAESPSQPDVLPEDSDAPEIPDVPGAQETPDTSESPEEGSAADVPEAPGGETQPDGESPEESGNPVPPVEGDGIEADPDEAEKGLPPLEKHEIPPQEEPELQIVVDDEEWFTNDELFALYVESLFGFGGDASVFSTGGGTLGSGLQGNLKTAYNEVKAEIEKILAGTRTSTDFTVSVSLAHNDWATVHQALKYDLAYELFWFGNVAGYAAAGQSGNRLILYVSKDYSSDGTYFDKTTNQGPTTVNASKISAAVQAKNNAQSVINGAKALATDYAKLKYINDEICRLVDYNYDALEKQPPYGDPWQMIWVFDGNDATKVVCEGYAKAFQYVCDQVWPSGPVQCYTATGQMQGGTGAGPHMWNIVTLDGKNYIVDVTNCDGESIGAPYGLFLAGNTGTQEYDPEADVVVKIRDGVQVHYWNDTTLPAGIKNLSINSTSYEEADGPKTIEVTADPAADATTGAYDVPTVDTPGSGKNTSITLAATVKNASGSAMADRIVSWSIPNYENPDFKPYITLTDNKDNTATLTFTNELFKLQNTSPSGVSVNVPVTAAYGASVTGNLEIKIQRYAPEVTFVVINGDESLVKGSTFPYTATVYDQYGEVVGNDPATTGVTWAIDPVKEGVAVNASSGAVTVGADVVAGTTFTLKATAGGKTVTKTVEVVDKTPHTITGTLENVELVVGAKNTQTVTCPTGGTVSYASSNISVATVTATGEVTAVGVGEATITVTAAGGTQYGPKTVTYKVTVTAKTLTAAMVADISAKPYTGDAQTPAVTVKDGAKTLVKDTDYTVSVNPASPTDAGSYTVTVTGTGNYTGTVQKTFIITQASLTTAPDVSNPAAVLASEGKDAAALLALAKAANADLKVKGVKNEDVSLSADWALVSGTYDAKGGAYVYELALTSGSANYIYKGTNPRVTVTVTPVNLTLTLSETSSTQKASQTADNWEPTVTVTAVCTPAVDPAPEVTPSAWTPTPTIAAAKAAVNSTGNPQTVTLKPTVSGVPTWATWDASKTPVYTLTLTAKDPAEITINGLDDKTYDGVAIGIPTFSVKDNAGNSLTESEVEYKFYAKGSDTALADAPKDAGEYTLRAAYSDPNYEGVKTKDFVIAKRPVALTWENIAARTYDNTPSTVSAKVGNLVSGDTDETVKVTVTGGDAVKAGTHTATASALTGDRSANYELPAAATQDYTINKAPRTLTVAPATLTLLPGSAEGTITVTPSADLDESFAASVQYALTGGVTAVTWNKTAGKVTGVGNGVVTISVSAEATENYEAAPAQTVTVTAVIKPVTGVSVTGGAGDKFTAVLEDKTVKVSGVGIAANAAVTLTLDTTVPGISQQAGASNTIEVVYGGNVIETYTVNTSGVVEKPANVTLVENPTQATAPDGFNANATEAVESTTATGLMAASAGQLMEIAKGKQGEGVTDVKVETRIKVEAKDYVDSASEKSLTVEITPQYIITVTKDGAPGEPELQTIPNSAIRSAVTLEVTLPTGFLTHAAGEKVFVEHTPSNGGRMEVIRATVNGDKVTWQQTSFSTDKIVVNSQAVTVEFDDGTTKQTVTYDYADAVNGTALPSSGSNTGWTYDGRNYTAMTKDLFDALVTAGGTQTFTPAAPGWPVTPPSRPAGGKEDVAEETEPRYYASVSKGIRNGTVTVSPSRAEAGDSVTVTPKPSSGYELDTLRVLDKNGERVELRESNGKYVFIMPKGGVTVDATFKATGRTGGHPFRDVPASFWAGDAITWAYENGYMNGNSAVTFNPNGTITRQQLWMILARLNGADPASFAEARRWAVDNGVSDGSNPTANMSRQQMVTFLHRYAAMKGYRLSGSADLTAFPDHASVAGYAKEPLSWSVANSIVSGTANGTLNPGGTATRAQFAVILQRFYGSVVGG